MIRQVPPGGEDNGDFPDDNDKVVWDKLPRKGDTMMAETQAQLKREPAFPDLTNEDIEKLNYALFLIMQGTVNKTEVNMQDYKTKLYVCGSVIRVDFNPKKR